MTIVITVSSADSSSLVLGLTDAARRRGLDYALFFTGAGVSTLKNANVIDGAHGAFEAIACERAWHQYVANESCPVEIGSQTDHSRMLKTAFRLVTL